MTINQILYTLCMGETSDCFERRMEEFKEKSDEELRRMHETQMENLLYRMRAEEVIDSQMF